MDVSMFSSLPEFMNSSPLSYSSSNAEILSNIYSSQKGMVDEERELDVFLLEAMVCSICYAVYDEPKQLQCGHSFCTACIDRLCNETEEKYTCPLCRAEFTSPPVVNYSLKSLISRIKEKDAMVKCCHQCSKPAKPEDQYRCDDCDHIDREERVRCGLCVINEHAKRGHNVSKYGDSGEVIKRAQRTLNEILNETVQFLTVCEKLAADSLVCVDNLFKLLDGQRTYFKALIVALGTDVFLSKKDIEMRLENARQLHGIYMRSALEFTRLMSIMFNEISTLTEKTAAELAGHTVYGDILSKREMIAQSEQEQTQTQSWFEYQRTGRVSTLCSALARRNAAIARRRLMTYNPQSESGMTVNTLPLSSASSSIASAFPVSRNEILLVDRT